MKRETYTPTQFFLVLRFDRVIQIRNRLSKLLPESDGTIKMGVRDVVKTDALRGLSDIVSGAYIDLAEEGLGDEAIEISVSRLGPREDRDLYLTRMDEQRIAGELRPIVDSVEVLRINNSPAAGGIVESGAPQIQEETKESSLDERVMANFFAEFFPVLPEEHPREEADRVRSGFRQWQTDSFDSLINDMSIDSQAAQEIVNNITPRKLSEFAKENAEKVAIMRGVLTPDPQGEEYQKCSHRIEYWERTGKILEIASRELS